ncbi:MAG: spore coat protein U domain-containing protein [Deltaproteobacteria bacterium]|nr:spore coat protein U domain-containing protein [Deltaproteobacteria bacterium]
MKRLILIAAAIITAVMVSSTAMAVGTNTMTVTASVTGVCKFSATTSTLAFGALDASVATAATATTGVNFWCTKGTTYSVADDSGLYNSGGPRMRHATVLTEFIPYSIVYGAAGTGSGKNTAITLTVDGTIANADYVDAQAGAYSDTVVLTVNP